MKLLRRLIRDTIKEAMKQGSDLPEGYFFSCASGLDAAYGFPQIILVKPNGFVDLYMKVECFFAEMDNFDKDLYDEFGYKIFDLRRLDSQPFGFGPLVTEIAIEWTTLLGGVLFPDRREMSKAAQTMWDKFSGRPGFEEFEHPTLGVKGYRRVGAPTIKSLEANGQLFRSRFKRGENGQRLGGDQQYAKEYKKLSTDYSYR